MMARRRKKTGRADERLIRAKNLFAKVVTNRAAGLVLPVVSEKISIQVQKGDHCELKSYKERGYYVSEIVDVSIKKDVDELVNSMLLKKIGCRKQSTVVFNTMSNDDSSLLNDHRQILEIERNIRVDEGRNQLKKSDLSDSSADTRLKILIDRIEKHLQEKILFELNVDFVPDDKRVMTVSLLETQPPVQYQELVDGKLITKVDSVCMLMLILCLFLSINC